MSTQMVLLILGAVVGLLTFPVHKHSERLEQRAQAWAREKRPLTDENIGKINTDGDQVLRWRNMAYTCFGMGATLLVIVITT